MLRKLYFAFVALVVSILCATSIQGIQIADVTAELQNKSDEELQY